SPTRPSSEAEEPTPADNTSPPTANMRAARAPDVKDSKQGLAFAPLPTPSPTLPPESLPLPVETPSRQAPSEVTGEGGLFPGLDPRMIYRIPRGQVTNGVRALGRLAFVDNQRTLAKRFQADLDGCLNPTALAVAGRQTGLGVRSNRPRVYVVAGLGGGTGGGM